MRILKMSFQLKSILEMFIAYLTIVVTKVLHPVLHKTNSEFKVHVTYVAYMMHIGIINVFVIRLLTTKAKDASTATERHCGTMGMAQTRRVAAGRWWL